MDEATQKDHVACSINVPIPILSARVASPNVVGTVSGGTGMELLWGQTTRANLRSIEFPDVRARDVMDSL